ncbi:glycoside hydrolase family 16 protein [Dethiobacter alkaliphilus]|nr:family 16 glycosylhydrolase [Dethiobacter alkaliphilus]
MQRGFGWIPLVAILTISLIIGLNQLNSIYQALSSNSATAAGVYAGFDISLDTDDWTVIWHDELSAGELDLYKWKPQDNGFRSVFSLLYGKIEIRARLSESGTLPSAWLIEENENISAKVNIFHRVNHSNLSADYHTFGIEWDQEKIVWLFDGKETFSTTRDIPDTRQFLYLSSHDSNIDYVRVFKKAF